ncbi:extracellular solute-binding protein [Paenibacillus nasutitermitis]|uniref:Sugar ABC transporter substrate-binding protein n=1 Tax=Paenibacillus nasutitermitis TaxID=1652958 RepID=A0A917DQD8_9BACL|nr:extracellular solute-binding protein [Paenibacillus nasutitermitis]GGD60851.1 sugar ABC transporter substrate-binding protein [Paenibacillus nasutitermitis]
MKASKQIIHLIMMLALILILGACSSGNKNNEGNAPANAEAGSKGNEKKEVVDSGTERLKLNWFVNSSGDAVLPKGNTDFIRQAIEQKFNVELNIQHMPAGGDFESKISLLLASGDTPDLFTSTGIASQKFILDGVTADMTPFVTPEKMPNYFKWISNTELERYAVEKKFERAPVIFPREVYRSYYIRQDWLDNLGLKMPTNYEEMLKVMHAFTFDDPDGNGKKDTFGLTAAGNGTTLSFDFPQWIENGLIGAFMVRDNKIVDVQSDLAVGQVLQGVKDMMKEGTVDPDWFLLKGTEHIDKAVGGKAGIVVGGSQSFAFDSEPTSIQNKTKAINPKANWMPFHPFAATGTWTENLPETPFLFSRQTAEKEPEKIERIVQILDWMASEEGFLLINYGEEGKHYTRSGKTITVTSSNMDAYNKDVVEQGNFPDVYRFFYSHNPEYTPLGLDLVDERLSDRDRQINDMIQTYKLIPSIGTNVSPPAGFNLSDFRKKMREYHVRILFDEADASNWPKYQEELLTKFGGQQMIDTYTEQIKAAGVIK